MIIDELKYNSVSSEDQQKLQQTSQSTSSCPTIEDQNQKLQNLNSQELDQQKPYKNSQQLQKEQILDPKLRKKLRKKFYRKRKQQKYKQKQLTMKKFQKMIEDFYQLKTYCTEREQQIKEAIELQKDYMQFCLVVDHSIRKVQYAIKRMMNQSLLKPQNSNNKIKFNKINSIHTLFLSINFASHEVCKILVDHIDRYEVYQDTRKHTSQQIRYFLHLNLKRRIYRHFLVMDGLQLKNKFTEFCKAINKNRDKQYQDLRRVKVPETIKMIKELKLQDFSQTDIRYKYFEYLNFSTYLPDQMYFNSAQPTQLIKKIMDKTKQNKKDDRECCYQNLMDMLDCLDISQLKRQNCAVSPQWLAKVQGSLKKKKKK